MTPTTQEGRNIPPALTDRLQEVAKQTGRPLPHVMRGAISLCEYRGMWAARDDLVRRLESMGEKRYGEAFQFWHKG